MANGRCFGHDSGWLSLVEEGIEQALSGASEDVDIVEKAKDTGRFSYSSQAWQQVDAFRRAIFDSRAPDLAFALLDSNSMNLFYDFLLIKEAGTANATTPWHQDHAYYPLHGVGVVNCWTALDPIPMATACGFGRGHTGTPVFIRQLIFLAILTTGTCVQIDRLFRISIVISAPVFLRRNSSPEICWSGIRIPSTAHPVTPWVDVEPLSQSIGRRMQSVFKMFPVSQVIEPPS